MDVFDKAMSIFESQYPHHDFRWSKKHNKVMGLCPAHDDKHPSFNIFISGNAVFYKCFSCGYKGLLFKLEGDDLAYATFEGEYVGNQLSYNEQMSEIAKKLFLAISEYKKNFSDILLLPESFSKKVILGYLSARRVTEKDIIDYGLTCCLNPQSKYYGYIGCPLYNEVGKFVNYVLRKVPGLNKVGPKYLLPSIPKNEEIYLFNKDQYDYDFVVLTEGYFDALNLAKAGFTSFPLLGKVISTTQIVKLLDYGFKNINIGLDRDALHDSISIRDRLLQFGVKVRIIKLTEYKDFGEMPIDYIKHIVLDEASIVSLVDTIEDILRSGR